MTKTKSPAKTKAKTKTKRPAKATAKRPAKTPPRPAAKNGARKAAAAVAAKPSPAKASRRAAPTRPMANAKARPAGAAVAPIEPPLVIQRPRATAIPPAAPATQAAAREPATDADGNGPVDAFLDDATHPLKDSFAAVRQLILDVSPSISEGIKWNAPSFRTTDWFATFFLRDLDRIKIVFHLGAKKRTSTDRLAVGAPEGMVEWLGPDRCMVTLADAVAVKKRAKAFQAFVRAWILHV